MGRPTVADVGKLRISPGRYRALCTGALLALGGIVLTGGAVRLTGSGLGCTDWPTCSQDRLVASLDFHPMMEFVNRLLTGVVSVAVMAAVLGALARVPRRRDLVWLAWGLVAGVIGQILLGAAVVLADLAPPFTIGHFLLSSVLVANAIVLRHRAGTDETAPSPTASTTASTAAAAFGGAPPINRSVRRLTALVLVTAALVTVAGTVVTGAGPHGGDDRAARIDVTITTVSRIHSLAAWTFLAILIALWLVLVRRGVGGPPLRAAQGLIMVAAAQGALGYVQYFMGIPALLVGFHLLGATLVWAGAVQLALEVGLRSPAADALAGDGKRERVRGSGPVLSRG